MIRKRVLAVLMLVSIVFLPGCWDKRELTDLALISAIGIDKKNNGKYVLHFQIINPGNVAGGLQGGGAGDRPPVSVYSVAGDNLTEAMRRASVKISRRLYYSHTNLVVISEKLAREDGLNDVFDNLERDTEFRTTATVVIAHKTKAENIIKVLTPIDKIPSNKVNKTLDFTESQYGKNMKTNIQDIIKCLVVPTKSPIITGFTMKGDSEKGKSLENTQSTESKAVLQADGLAVFKHDGRLQYWIEDKNGIGVMWLLNRIKHTYINANWKQVENAISLQVSRQKTKVSASLQNGQPHIHVHITVEGTVDAVKYPFHLSDPKVLEQLERVLSKQLKKDIAGTVQSIKKNKVDIVGFGDPIFRNYPKVWKKIEPKWEAEYLPNLPVDIKVETFIRRTGLRNNPLQDKFDRD
ncbi:Ger(x)C family spore germination protein [Bacillus atrophaeus]|uniref:Ger(x)C family spore germination protein n=1 Tax=Bacillus atrophaeus TaxID=1452 RepID=UPI00228296F3|nr:Ger(x)C family spore germination protein [Bacillus atrophaeus]MCY9165255.1 Ger(x)C family spore germination protein [Bacillus atrophaeus]